MSRTYRQNPSRPLDYVLTGYAEHRHGGQFYVWEAIPLTRGGWTEAKRLLDKVEYAYLRRKRGDCLTKDYLRGSIPRHYRQEHERSHRQHTARELRRYAQNVEYEPMVDRAPRDAGTWYW